MLKVIGQLTSKKPTVLFIPGSLCNPEIFKYVDVKKEFQSGMVDWGMSEGPWTIDGIGRRVSEYITEKDFGPTVLVGHSLGGVIAMCSALTGNKRIAGLMLSNTGANTKNHGYPNFPQDILDHWGKPELIEPFLAHCFSKPIDPEIKKLLLEYINKLNKQTAYESIYSLSQLDISDRLGEIKCPVYIVHGKDDTMLTIMHAQQLKDGIPNSKLVFLPGGHTIFIENKDGWMKEFNELLDIVLCSYNNKKVVL